MRSIIFFSVIITLVSCQRKTIPVKPAELIGPFLNVVIESSAFGTSTSEPSICISPKDPNKLVAGSILDLVYTSSDGGVSWTKAQMKSSSGVYGDPVIRADFDGNFYYAHLSNPTGNAWQDEAFLDRIVIQRSSDGGRTWNDGSYTPPNTPKDQDKEWLAVNPSDNTILMTWTEFDKYNSTEPGDHSRIMFVKSTDKAESWTDPIILSQYEGDCLDGDQTTEGAVPAVGPNGEYYVSWSYDEKIYFDRSQDGGKTWMVKDKVVASQPGGWNFDIPGISRCNGMPITEVDLSSGSHRGDIYVNWSDQRNGTDDTDIWLSKSVDGGDSWSTPMRINDDTPGSQQFFCWMDVDPITGYVYIIFYDRRAYDDLKTDVYLAYSVDGGSSFKNVKISDTPFKPTKYVFFGDYTDISAYGGRVRPIWTRADGARLSCRTAIIEHK